MRGKRRHRGRIDRKEHERSVNITSKTNQHKLEMVGRDV